ncbi:ApeP family dehydratase [Chromohalobacter japonicus]|uniref:ApeP family dehydratase n=1 Tax=Chromohalobacter japonicus TaxID=223900 RepID=UPI003F93AC0C
MSEPSPPRASSAPALPCDIAPYVPHQREMCLLQRLMAVDADTLIAEITPRREDPFAVEAGIPGWVGLEWMAQAIAAWAGVMDDGPEAPTIGFLLGSRSFHVTQPFFAFDIPLYVSIQLDFQAENGLGAFQAQITTASGEALAQGSLNVYRPPSNEALDAMKQGKMP